MDYSTHERGKIGASEEFFLWTSEESTYERGKIDASEEFFLSTILHMREARLVLVKSSSCGLFYT